MYAFISLGNRPVLATPCFEPALHSQLLYYHRNPQQNESGPAGRVFGWCFLLTGVLLRLCELYGQWESRDIVMSSQYSQH